MATMQNGTVLRQINRLFGAGTVAGLSDAQLTARFRARRDEAAFAALVARHGPMVLAVCRGILRDSHDAEDAFQATFLILARRAGALWVGESLGGWLHRVAHRVALQARADAARRRVREQRAGAAAMAERAREEPRDDELRALLHAEIGRLPDRLRLPVVLCDLEGLTRDQAAERLCWTEGTIRGRLARARAILRERLTRRGVAIPAGMLAAALAREASATAVPNALLTATARAAVGQGIGAAAATIVGRVIRSMALARLKAVAALTLTAVALAGTSAGLLAFPGRDEPAPPGATSPAAPKAGLQPVGRDMKKAAGDPPAPKPAVVPGGSAGVPPGLEELEYKGRVVDPAGRPIDGAKVYLDVFVARRDPPSAVTGPDGRFRFTVRGDETLRRNARVTAEADGFALGTASGAFLFGTFPNADPPDAGRDLTVTLRDDQPIEGRVVDLEGRPIADASVRVRFVYAPPEGDLTPWLEALKAREAPVDDLKFKYLKRVYLLEQRPNTSVKTDAQGRFTLKGLGRDRLADIEIEAATIRPLEVQVMTRPGEPFRALKHPQFAQFGSITYYGASPRLVAAPSRPIEGVVRDKETREPIAGAVIQSTKLADRDVWNDIAVEATSDARGHYRLTGLPRGSGNVIVVGPPPGQTYLPAQIEVENPPGLNPITLDIALPKGIVIEGRVADLRTGEPVAARVVYHAAADNPNLDTAPGFRANTVSHGRLLGVDTARDGRFKIAGLRGRGALVVETRDRAYPGDNNGGRARFDFIPSIQGFHQAVVMIDVPMDAQSYGQDIRLDSGRAIEGAVLDPEGKPLDGVQVYGLQNLGSWEPLVGSTFRVVALQPAKEDREGKPRPARSLVFLHESRKLAGWVDLRGDEPGPLRIALEPWSTAGGRLVDPEGKPRPDVTLQVNAKRPRLGGGQIWHEPQRVRTDVDGRFRIEGLAPGLPYELSIQAPSGQRANRRVDVSPTTRGETRDLGTIAVEFRDQ